MRIPEKGSMRLPTISARRGCAGRKNIDAWEAVEKATVAARRNFDGYWPSGIELLRGGTAYSCILPNFQNSLFDRTPRFRFHRSQAGGLGYVLKSDARSDLLAGIRAVLRG